MSLQGVSIIVTSSINYCNKLDNFLSSFFTVNTHTPVEVIFPVDVLNPGNKYDIILKYATKTFIRPVVYTDNKPVSELTNLCATKARYPFLFFVGDHFDNYKKNILEEALCALSVQDTEAVILDYTNKDKLSLINIRKAELKHCFSRIVSDLCLICSKKSFQTLNEFHETNTYAGILLKNDITSDASKTPALLQNPKISIIIPVYKSEPYLRKCIESVINQTFKNIEIVIVNDCTPDNSEKIILEYLNIDPRIIYIKHKKNLGLGGVRNTGIEVAKGEYQWHIDSDDYIDTNACKILYGTAKKNQVDILTFSGCNFEIENNFNIYHNECFSRDKFICNKVYSGLDFFKKANEKKIFHCAIWLNLINSQFLKEFSKLYKFRENVYHQDTDYTPILYTHAKSVLCIHYTPYQIRLQKVILAKTG